MDWSHLDKPGPNGFLLVMVQLTWWGKLSGNDDEWSKAVEDVTAVLRVLRCPVVTRSSPPASPVIPTVPRSSPPVSPNPRKRKNSEVDKSPLPDNHTTDPPILAVKPKRPRNATKQPVLAPRTTRSTTASAVAPRRSSRQQGANR